jgi:mitogen-activated protein kinase 1/2
MVPIDLDIDENMSSEMIQEMMWQEMLHYHHPQVVVSARILPLV